MSIFGKLDAENISSNPFRVDRGVYPGEVIKSEFRETQKGQRQYYLAVQIEDPESEFDGERVDRTYFLPDADMDEEKLASLPVEERRRILKNAATLKKDLCGEESRADRKGLGVDPNDLNGPDWNPASVVGSKVTIGVNVYKDKSSISFVNLRDE